MAVSLLKRLFSFAGRDDRKHKASETKWALLSESEVAANLDAIEQFIAIAKPVPDDLYRFLAWAVERACHDAFNAGRAFSLPTQIIILDAVEALMRGRTTTTAQRLDNDRYYMSNLVSTGKMEGTLDEIYGTLQQAIDRTKRLLLKQGEVYPAQGDNFPKSFRHCLNLKQETWPAPLHSYMSRYAVDLVAIARGEV